MGSCQRLKRLAFSQPTVNSIIEILFVIGLCEKREDLYRPVRIIGEVNSKKKCILSNKISTQKNLKYMYIFSSDSKNNGYCIFKLHL